MREHKYRCWDGKRMLYGDDVPEYLEPTNVNCYFTSPNKEVWLEYTGLSDKNGKEIYEKDIMVCRNENGNIEDSFVVRFNKGCFVNDKNLPLRKLLDLYINEGNEFENPELLGVK